jgi:hypothetical protein
MQNYRFIIVTSLFIFISAQTIYAQNKYIGVKNCTMCHKTDKQGKQLDIWKNSGHSKAFQTLTTKKADEIAKAQGLKKPAAESPECLECHVSGYGIDAKLLDKNFDYKDGVQCETCHGAGSQYKALQIMKDRKKAIAAGLREFKDPPAIEKYCKTCHNEKSPTYKGFKFKEDWEKIKHPVPKK